MKKRMPNSSVLVLIGLAITRSKGMLHFGGLLGMLMHAFIAFLRHSTALKDKLRPEKMTGYRIRNLRFSVPSQQYRIYKQPINGT